MTTEKAVIDFMDCLFIFLLSLFIFVFFLLSHTDQHHGREKADESKSTMTTTTAVKKNRIELSIYHTRSIAYVRMCSLFVVTVEERKNEEESSQPFIP